MQPLEIEPVVRRRELNAMERSWLLRSDEPNFTRTNRTWRFILWTVTVVCGLGLAAVVITSFVKTTSRHPHHSPGPNNYSVALSKSLLFFNGQRSGKLPAYNNISWRRDACLKDGDGKLSGGFFDGGSAIKYNFPQSFAITLLSWGVIEYKDKYAAAGELDHAEDIIRWGADYLLGTFDQSVDRIDGIVAQVKYFT